MNSLHWAYVMWVTTYPWSFSDLLSTRASIPWRAKLQLKSWRLALAAIRNFFGDFLGGLQCFFCLADVCFKGHSYPNKMIQAPWTHVFFSICFANMVRFFGV